MGTVGIVLFPVICYLMLKAAHKAYKEKDVQRFFLAWLIIPTVAFFCYTGLQSKVQPNWPQVAYLSAFLLVAEWIVISIKAGSYKKFYICFLPSLLLSCLALFHCFFLFFPLPPRSDVGARMHGWRPMGELIKRVDVETNHKAIFVVNGTTLASLIGYYGNIESNRLLDRSLAGNFRVWHTGTQINKEDNVIFVDLDNDKAAERFADLFDNSEINKDSITFSMGTRYIRRVNISFLNSIKETFVFEPSRMYN